MAVLHPFALGAPPMVTEVVLSRPEPGVALLRLDAPDRRNALVGTMARRIVTLLREIDEDHEVGAVVLSGGPDAFCAGAHRQLLSAAGAGDPDARADLESVYEIFAVLRGLRAPTIATICGPAVGAGLNLALACDARLVGDNAYLRSMFMANGIHPGGGHLKMLVELGGSSLAVELAGLDRPLDAAAAVSLGLASGPCEPTEAEAQGVRMARAAGENPGLARLIKRTAKVAGQLTMEEAIRQEADLQLGTLTQGQEGSGSG